MDSESTFEYKFHPEPAPAILQRHRPAYPALQRADRPRRTLTQTLLFSSAIIATMALVLMAFTYVQQAQNPPYATTQVTDRLSGEIVQTRAAQVAYQVAEARTTQTLLEDLKKKMERLTSRVEFLGARQDTELEKYAASLAQLKADQKQLADLISVIDAELSNPGTMQTYVDSKKTVVTKP